MDTRENNKVSRTDIDNLVLDILSNVLTGVQKRTRVRNLLYEKSKKNGSIYNVSTSTANPVLKPSGYSSTIKIRN